MEREPSSEPIEPAEEADPAAEILTAATANAADGIQSYSHGSRQVTRSNPRTQLEFLQDLELRKRRARFGICVPC